MTTNISVTLLIEKAGHIHGSEYRLAKEMGIPQQMLTDWKAGRRACTPGDRARLAGFAREDAVQELVRATIEGAKGAKKEQLEKLMGKWLRQTGGAAGFAVLTLASTVSAMLYADIPRCILC